MHLAATRGETGHATRCARRLAVMVLLWAALSPRTALAGPWTPAPKAGYAKAWLHRAISADDTSAGA